MAADLRRQVRLEVDALEGSLLTARKDNAALQVTPSVHHTRCNKQCISDAAVTDWQVSPTSCICHVCDLCLPLHVPNVIHTLTLLCLQFTFLKWQCSEGQWGHADGSQQGDGCQARN